MLSCGHETYAPSNQGHDACSRPRSDGLAEEEEDMEIDVSLFAIKVVAVVAIVAAGVVGGVIPLLADRHEGIHRVLSLGNALAGGIFLGIGFIRLLPAAGDALATEVAYPLAPTLAAVGVVVLLLIDRVVFEATRRVGSAQGVGTRQPVYPVVLLGVLSIHSVIAGIALGLEPELAAFLLLTLGILFHKGSAAFALTASVNASGAERSRVHSVLTTFVVMTPVGIVIGMAVSGLLEGRTATLVAGSFNALAAGTFIYVAILDVIDSEMSRFDDRVAHFVHSTLIGQDDVPMPSQDADRMLKFVLVLVGLYSVAMLGIWM